MKRTSATLIFCLVLLAGCEDPYAPGKKLMDEGRHEEAAQYFIKLKNERPDDPRVRHELAFAYSRLKLPNQAAEEYKKAIELKPDYFEAVFNLGVVLGRAKRYEESIEYLKKAKELRPDNLDVRTSLAASYGWAKKYDQAIAELKEARKMAGPGVNYSDQIEEFEKMDKQWSKVVDWLNSFKPKDKDEEKDKPQEDRPATLEDGGQ